MRRTCLFLTALCAVFVPAATSVDAQPAKRPLTIEDYYRVLTVTNPQIAEDGKTVRFSVTARVEPDNSTKTETFTVPADGSAGPTKVETAPAGRGGGGRAGGTGAGSRVTSPDGKWIARTQEKARPKDEPKYATDFEKRHQERFKGVTFDWKDFQRDGAAFPAPDPTAQPALQIVVQPTDGGGAPRTLVDRDIRPANLTWHPNGKLLAFTADPEFRDELKYEHPDLWTVTTDGEVTRLTSDGAVHSDVDFSPDGGYLSYVRSLGTDSIIKQKLSHGGPRDIYLRPAEGMAQPINLTASWNLEPTNVRWSPDSRFLYFTAETGGEIHLFRVAPVAGARVVQVTKGARRLNSLTIDKSFTTIAYVVGTHDAPGDLYAADIDGTRERRLTNINKDLAAELSLPATERLQWASKDGTSIEGWLTLPANYDATKRYPLVVFSHGGPHAAAGYAFDFKKHYFAANGYFVLDTNFRSSTGYGDDFKWATWGAWGDKDGQDVIAGIDDVLKRYPIDGTRVGHTGHSYGGFMTNWLITQYPDRFAAAIAGAGISNWVSDYGTADIYRTKETEFFGTPWDKDARERMMKQSPLSYAGNVRTPTLFVHGEVDQRVPYEEGEQMYFALKRRGVPAKMIQYKDQPHGISGHWNNIHRMLNELQWWETYLKPVKKPGSTDKSR